MGKTLTEVAQQLKNGKQIQLIYAFNGTGKTRLSREFRLLVDPKNDDAGELPESTGVKVIYYNAFTEDLFFWDNDLNGGVDRKLKIQPNSFTSWVLAEQGQEPNIISNFQRYTNDKLTPRFNQEYTTTDNQGNESVVKAYSEVTFSLERGNDTNISNIKISKGEESNFVWCVFYSLLEQVVEVLNVTEPVERETDKFNQLKYIFIDDPVSSLDDNHLIELAVSLAYSIKSCKSGLKFIITTHNPLFFNVLDNELGSNDSGVGYKAKVFEKSRLEKFDDGSFALSEQTNDSPFSYHLYLLSVLGKSIESGDIQKFHFNFLRNILEKTATFLGFKQWGDLLPDETVGERAAYVRRILNYSSHSKHSGEEVSIVNDDDKRMLDHLVKSISRKYSFKVTPTEAI